MVPAPPSAVRGWLTDYAHWMGNFPDVQSVEILSASPDGSASVRFKSSILDRTITVQIRQTPQGLSFTGTGKGVTTQGRTYLIPLADGRTRVVMQTSAEVHGALRLIVSEDLKRSRARKKLYSDLASLDRLASVR